MSAGASRAYVVDARERFVTDFVWPHLQANALYQGAYPLATALARPLIAQLLVEVAKREGADAVAHGCTGKGNDQVRFDVATHALDPGLEVIAPMRVGMGLSRDQEIDYADRARHRDPDHQGVAVLDRRQPVGPLVRDRRARGPVGHAAGRRLRVDRRPGDGARPGRGRRSTSRAASRWPSTASGSTPVALVERLHDLGGAHGVGRIDHVEDRLVGIKSREIYEAPAATILHAAHRALEGLTLSQDTLRFNRFVADELARLTYDGLWFSALSRDLRAYVASSQRVVSRRGPDPAGPRQRGRRRAPLADVAVRQEPRDVRRGRRVRPRARRSGSSRSSGCRCGSRRRATAPSASTTARPGRGPIRCSPTCRRS